MKFAQSFAHVVAKQEEARNYLENTMMEDKAIKELFRRLHNADLVYADLRKKLQFRESIESCESLKVFRNPGVTLRTEQHGSKTEYYLQTADSKVPVPEVFIFGSVWDIAKYIRLEIRKARFFAIQRQVRAAKDRLAIQKKTYTQKEQELRRLMEYQARDIQRQESLIETSNAQMKNLKDFIFSKYGASAER